VANSSSSDATVTRLRRRQVGFVFQAFNLVEVTSYGRSMLRDRILNRIERRPKSRISVLASTTQHRTTYR
jgi:ABC-type lipoprotein export system ATPase subunit